MRLGRTRTKAGFASAVAGAILALSSCGEGGQAATVAEAPVPDECVGEWNGEKLGVFFGRHAYNDHDARQGRVTLEPVGPGASLSVKGPDTCAVIFAVPESDDEYGEVGWIQSKFGWQVMTELDRSNPVRLPTLQREAGSSPNVNLFPDGSISPR